MFNLKLKLKVVLGLVAVLAVLVLHAGAPSITHRIAGWTWAPSTPASQPEASRVGWKWSPSPY